MWNEWNMCGFEGNLHQNRFLEHRTHEPQQQKMDDTALFSFIVFSRRKKEKKKRERKREKKN